MSIRTKYINTNLYAKGKFYQNMVQNLSDALLWIPVETELPANQKHSGDYFQTPKYSSISPLQGIMEYPGEMKTTGNLLNNESAFYTLQINEELPIKLRTFQKLSINDIIVDYIATGPTFDDMILTFLEVAGMSHDMKERTRQWYIYHVTQKFDFLEGTSPEFKLQLERAIQNLELNKKEEIDFVPYSNRSFEDYNDIR